MHSFCLQYYDFFPIDNIFLLFQVNHSIYIIKYKLNYQIIKENQIWLRFKKVLKWNEIPYNSVLSIYTKQKFTLNIQFIV